MHLLELFKCKDGYFNSVLFSTGRTVEIVYVLNYNTKINEIITESKYMEQLGFQLPEIARNLALQVAKLVYFEKIFLNETLNFV